MCQEEAGNKQFVSSLQGYWYIMATISVFGWDKWVMQQVVTGRRSGGRLSQQAYGIMVDCGERKNARWFEDIMLYTENQDEVSFVSSFLV